MERAEANKEYLKQVGLRIRAIRKAKGIRQIELAYRCDFDKQMMSRIELGESNATILTLKKLADALGIEVFEFFKKDQ